MKSGYFLLPHCPLSLSSLSMKSVEPLTEPADHWVSCQWALGPTYVYVCPRDAGFSFVVVLFFYLSPGVVNSGSRVHLLTELSPGPLPCIFYIPFLIVNLRINLRISWDIVMSQAGPPAPVFLIQQVWDRTWESAFLTCSKLCGCFWSKEKPFSEGEWLQREAVIPIQRNDGDSELEGPSGKLKAVGMVLADKGARGF